MNSGLRALVLVALAFLIQSTPPKAFAFLEDLQAVSSDADLYVFIDRFPQIREAPASQGFWRLGVAIAREELDNDQLGRAAIVRLFRLALLLDRDMSAGKDWPLTMEPFDTLTQGDLEALRRATGGFPQETDAIIYLLNRNPSLRYKPAPGQYLVHRFVRDSASSVVVERSSVPYMDLGPTWLKREFENASDPVKTAGAEYAQTRKFSLDSLPDIVLAAKAFRIAELAPPHSRWYAEYVAGEALSRSLRQFVDRADTGAGAGYTIWAMRQKMINSIAESADDALRDKLLLELRVKIPSSAFDSRAFHEAAEAYRKLSETYPEGRLVATWGEAISYFAAGESDNSAAAFQRMIPFLSNAEENADVYAYMFTALLRSLPSTELATLGDLRTVHEAANRRLESVNPPVDELISWDMALGNIMTAIGRPDLGLTHFAHRLSVVDTLPETERDQAETSYLRNVAARSRDICYHISWMMSASGVWTVRPTIGYPAQLDFLDAFNEDGELVDSGEIVTVEDGIPYGMVSPEEDCGLISTVYGVHSDAVFEFSAVSLFGGRQDDAATGSGMSAWAASALNRESPSPSIAPYLKLIWQEWFASQFVSLQMGQTARIFTYCPLNATAIADPKQVEELKDSLAATPQQHALIDLLLSVRSLLERRYSCES